MMNARNLVVIDGRVFATEAAERGMGRYVGYIAETFIKCGCEVLVIVPPPNVPERPFSSGVRSETLTLEDDPMLATLQLNRLLADRGATAYLDATPFLPPARYDIYACPVIAVLFDLIPMRFPNDYFSPTLGAGPLDAYINGLARVQKADHVIAISEYVKSHALRYLGVPRRRCSVLSPAVHRSYWSAVPDLTRLGNTITCIQGAHRSKNYPAAIGFLERLSAKSECDVDVIVPTPTQRNLIEAVRNPSFTRLHVDDSLTEDRKVALQRNARAIAHLSLDEGYGIPLAEALYLYRPIICVDNAVNRELLSGCEDPLAAGVLLLKDPKLASERELQATADFVRNVRTASYHEQRRWIVDRLMAQQREAPARARTALESAASEFESWHARAGMGLVAPTELGGCGVSDYCLALTRSDTPRYVVLLGPAPRELQLAQSLRLVPIAALDELRGRTPGLVFNLAVSDSLTRGFDAIADGSSAADVLVIHDAGSYLPGLLMQASAKGDERLLFERYLRDEPDQVRKLARAWLADPEQDIGHNGHLFLDLDRAFRSNWLRSFRGRLISHHAAFSDDVRDRAAILALLSSDSEIRRRAEYVPMPIDARVTPGALRFAGKMRWALGLSRHDLLVCCAGSVVRGKHLDVVARVCAGLDERARPPGVSGSVTLLLAGRVLDDPLFAEMRGIFASAGAPNRIVQIVETSEARYDALLLASDVVVAFREQRRIQMSHSYVRALALGRPMVTNSGAGFDDGDAAAICNDEHLEGDLERHLLRLWERSALRFELSESSQKAFRARHTVTGFFEQCERASDVTSLV